MLEVESFFLTIADFKKKSVSSWDNRKIHEYYYVPLFNYPTIDIVILSPYVFDRSIGDYVVSDDACFTLVLVDNETDIVIGNMVDINYSTDFEYDWQDELMFYIYTAEERLQKCQCPVCEFWLVQRTNRHGHTFIGCSGYPDCTFSIESKILLD